MKRRPKRERDGLVHFDPEKLERQLLRLGLSKTGLADRADVSRNTVLKAFRGDGIFPKNALGIAQALEVDDANVLLPSETEDGAVTGVTEAPIGGEWAIEGYLGPWVTASNELQFRVCRMRHQFVESRLGRGKWYDLLHLSTRDRNSLRAHLVRHPTVCERIGPHPGQELGGVPRLDYLPDFEEQMIEAALQQTWSRIGAMLTWTPPVALVVGVAGLVWDWRFWLVLIPLGMWLLQSLARQLRNVLELSRRLRAAREAAPSEPDPNSTQLQDVNWWSLLKAGFTPVEYEEPHEDIDVNLAGKPWRVLHKGSLRIPVFRKRRGKEQLYPQHFARMAAYCHLIETAEGGSAPYGVVLFGDGYGGVTVPNTRENREAFQKALGGARRVIEAVQAEQLVPDVPGQESRRHGARPKGLPRLLQRHVCQRLGSPHVENLYALTTAPMRASQEGVLRSIAREVALADGTNMFGF